MNKFMKLVKLEGFMKSEFEPNFDFYEIFENHGLYSGRMLSGSKSGYFSQHPKNTVVFNGNVVVENGGKIWYGDLDVTKEFDTLKEIADEIGQDLYILREHDARFDKENAGIKYWKKNAVTVIKCKK